MGVCEVTAEIAASIRRDKRDLTPRENYLLWVLEGMPFFRDINKFPLFETAYMQVAPDKDLSMTEDLIDAVYWLGVDCFYGAYSSETTRIYYLEKLMPLLASHGIKTPKDADLSTY